MHGHEVGHTGQAGHRVNFSIFFIGDVTIEGFWGCFTLDFLKKDVLRWSLYGWAFWIFERDILDYCCNFSSLELPVSSWVCGEGLDWNGCDVRALPAVLAVLLSWLYSGKKFSERSLTSIRHLNEHIIQYTGGFKYCIITVSFYFMIPIPYFHPPLRGRVRRIDDNFSIPHSHSFSVPGIHGSVEDWGIFSQMPWHFVSEVEIWWKTCWRYFSRLESFKI